MTIELAPDFRFSPKPIDGADEGFAATARGRMAAAFADRLYLSDGGAFLVTGYRGVGKTTFVHAVTERLRRDLDEQARRDRAERVRLVDICLNIARPLSGVELMHYILRQLHNRLADLNLLLSLPRRLRSQLRFAFLRTSAMLASKNSESTEASFNLERWLSLGSKISVGHSRDINYLAYDERSAEQDLIAMAQQLVNGFKPSGRLGISVPFRRPIRLKLLFVFDELDKIDEGADSESSLTNILHSLKTLFTTSGITFLFVAGRSLHEHWVEDVRRGDSVFESVFSELHYLPAVWDQVDEICDPLLSESAKLSDYDRELYGDFKQYLAFAGRGIPRRILRSFFERVRWDGKKAILALSEQDRRQMRFHAELYTLLSKSEEQILGAYARDLRPDWSDKQRLGLYYLVDWILDRGTAIFGLPDLVDAASTRLRGDIAPAPEVAPSVAAGLLELLCEHRYAKKLANSDESKEEYRLLSRRLIEMGRFRDLESPSESEDSGQILARRYQLLEKIGAGASAEVFRALDRQSGRLVAIKRYSKQYFSADSSLHDRLSAEAHVQRGLRHPGVARFLDVHFDEDPPFIVLEYIDGVTLRGLLEVQGQLAIGTALTVVRNLLETLAYLHDNNVLWRDVKPSNVLLTKDGRVVILDFGIAQTLQNAETGPDTTRLGIMAGTPAYTSPEQLRGEALTPASDLFSVGILLFEMLTGERPWVADTIPEFFIALQSKALEDSAAFEGIPADIRAVVGRALSLSAASRFQTAQEMLSALPEGDALEGIPRSFGKSQTGFSKMNAPLRDATKVSPIDDEGAVAARTGPPASDGMGYLSAPPSESDETQAPDPPGLPDAPLESVMLAGPAPPEAVSAAGRRNAVAVDPASITVPRGYPVVEVVDSDGTRYFGLFGSEVTLGRAPDCDIKINDLVASRFHARIVQQEPGYRIEDLNSTNGVYVNGTRVYRTHLLADADRIQLGDAELVFEPPELARSRRRVSVSSVG